MPVSQAKNILLENQAIRYYKALIQRNVVMDKSVHNFYVYLCIVEPGNSYLTEYLALSSGKPKFEYLSAISHCRARGKKEALIQIHMAFGEVVLAAEAAIKADIEQANKLLQRLKPPAFSIDSETLKRLHTQFFKATLERYPGRAGITRILSFVERHPILSMQDVLSMISDRVSLELLESLSMSQLNKIELSTKKVKDEMKSLVKLIESPMDERSKLVLSPEEIQICALSGSKIQSPLDRLVFPCGHVLSLAEVVTHLMDHVFKHPEVLYQGAYEQELLRNERQKANIDRHLQAFSMGKPTKRDLNMISRPQWEILAKSECVLCGAVMVSSAQDPLFSEEELATGEFKL